MGKTFILSDQSLNSYGLVILTGGISLKRFESNPVMLYNHDNDDPCDVIGKWENVHIDGMELKADANFDTDDDYANKIAKKVDKDFIKGASIGVDFKLDDVMFDLPGYEGTGVITKCELCEASITPTPSNKNALKLYNEGTLLKDKETITALLSKGNPNQNIKPMKKIALFATALNLSFNENTTEEHVLEGVKALATERDTLKVRLEAAIVKLSNAEAQRVSELVDKAIENKKITAEQKETYLKLAKADFDSTAEILNKMVAHVSISSQLNKDNKSNADFTDWDYEKFAKENPNELERIMKEEPARFSELKLAFSKKVNAKRNY